MRDKILYQITAIALAPILRQNTHIEEMCFIRPNRENTMAYDTLLDFKDPTTTFIGQAIFKDTLAPRMTITSALVSQNNIQICYLHRPDHLALHDIEFS